MLEKLSGFVIGRAHAAVDWNKLFSLNLADTNKTGSQSIFVSLMGNITTWILAIAGITAFIYLIISGIKYITAGGDAAKATEARTGIINAIIGVVVVLLAWVILNFAFGLGKEMTS